MAFNYSCWVHMLTFFYCKREKKFWSLFLSLLIGGRNWFIRKISECLALLVVISASLCCTIEQTGSHSDWFQQTCLGKGKELKGVADVINRAEGGGGVELEMWGVTLRFCLRGRWNNDSSRWTRKRLCKAYLTSCYFFKTLVMMTLFSPQSHLPPTDHVWSLTEKCP